MDLVTLALAKKYTRDSLIGVGAIKGAPCQIKSIVKQNGVNIVTFLWQDNDGGQHESTLQIDDGTPIYVWTAGDSYEYGDLVIYASMFYRCTHANSDAEWTPSHWSAIGNADGDYAIIQETSELPPRFTSADRKMYYVISEMCFFLWNGLEWVRQQSDITQEEIDNLFV